MGVSVQSNKNGLKSRKVVKGAQLCGGKLLISALSEGEFVVCDLHLSNGLSS